MSLAVLILYLLQFVLLTTIIEAKVSSSVTYFNLCFFKLQAGYEQAKKELQNEEWEIKIGGIEKIVTIARKDPEVINLKLLK